MNIRNFNKPRPRWAAATSKFIRAAAVCVGAYFFAEKSVEGLAITGLSNAVADFILDLFPNNSVTNSEDTNDN